MPYLSSEVTLSLVSLGSAELYLIIARSNKMTILCKLPAQRTAIEQHEVDRGLLRSLLLEMFLFVPASATLVLLILPPF